MGKAVTLSSYQGPKVSLSLSLSSMRANCRSCEGLQYSNIRVGTDLQYRGSVAQWLSGSRVIDCGWRERKWRMEWDHLGRYP